MVNRRTARLPRLLPLWCFLAACLLAAPLPAAAAPRPNPQIRRFDIAGVTLGMGLPQALRIITQTFVDEGLTEVTPLEPKTYTGDAPGPNAVVRIALAVAASTSASAPHYANDRFVLLLAGPASDERITAIMRDYLAPTGLDRAMVLRNLFHKYGQPADQMVPPANVGTDSATLTWMFGPGGGMTGGGAQSETTGMCTAGLFRYQDYFENASPDEQADIMGLLRQQSGQGCGLVMQVNFAFDSVHYALYDTGLAQQALMQAGGAVVAKAKAPAVNQAAVQAAAAIKY